MARSADRWSRISDLFDAAVDLPPGEQAAFLDAECGDDAGLRREVEELLEAGRRGGGVLDRSLGGLASRALDEVRPGSSGPAPPGDHPPAADGADRSTPRDAPGPAAPRWTAPSDSTSGRDRPATAGPYRLLRPVGRGGMGEVWQGFDDRLDRFVALKFLPADLAADGGAKARFRDEARAASRLDHPAICTVYDVGEDDSGRFYIAMAYYEGRTVAELLREGPLPVQQALELARRTAEGLARAHEAGIVHRDVKPANLMLTHRDELKILDFGVAKLDLGASAASGDLRVGTVAYMSPEQVRGEKVDPRSDLWSLGVVLFEMLAGRCPFTGPGPYAVMEAILRQPAPSPAELRAEVPAPLDALVRRCLAKRPQERFPSAAALAAALDRLREPTEAEPVFAGAGRRPSQAPPPRPLPAPLTPFFGREPELRRLEALLSRARLVTLTGPAGSGKSRLALEAARRIASRHDHGARFVPLAPVSDPEQVPAAIARALELSLPGGIPPLDALRDLLGDCDLLLVLDNFEHLTAAAPALADLLSGCPSLHALVTSQVVLRLSGEHTFPVSPLPVPPLVPAEGDLAANPAAALFLERARAVRPDLEPERLGDEDRAAVAEICVRLEGMPLALELAASRVRLFPPRVLRDRLGKRLDWLGTPSRDRPERQRTLRAALAWSHDLLGQEERRLFRRLAVFQGGFAVAEALGVAGLEGPGTEAREPEDAGDARGRDGGGHDDPGYDEAALLEGLSALVDHSLLTWDDSGEEPRFAMLEIIREHGLERLAVAGEERAARRAHALAFAALAERLEPLLTGPEPGRHLDRLEQDRANLEAAVAFAREDGEPEVGLRLAAALWRFWLVRGPVDVGLALADLLEVPGAEVPTRHRARALHGVGTLLHNLGANPRASRMLDEAIDIYRGLGDEVGVADGLNNLGWIAAEMCDLDRGEALSREALELHRRCGELRGQALAHNNLGWVAFYRGEYRDAAHHHRAGLELRRRIGDQRGVAFALHNLAMAERLHGGFREALDLLAEAEEVLRPVNDPLLLTVIFLTRTMVVRELEGAEAAWRLLERRRSLWREVGNASLQLWGGVLRGSLARELGDLEESEQQLVQVVRLWEEMHSDWGLGTARFELGWTRLLRGDGEAARREMAASFRARWRMGDAWGLAFSLEGLVVTGTANGAEAARWLGAAEGMRREKELVAESAWEPVVAAAAEELRRELAEEELEAARRSGAAAPWEVVEAVARQLGPDEGADGAGEAGGGEGGGDGAEPGPPPVGC